MNGPLALLPSHRRGEELARLLDDGARTDDPQLAQLERLATALQDLPVDGAPDPQFRTALRQRLVAVAAVQGVPAQRGSDRAREWAGSWRARRTAAVATGALAGVVAFAGVGTAASRSLPGDAFYPIKQATEAVQLQLTFGDYDRGSRHLDFARARLHEVQQLVADGASTDRIVSTLRAMDDETLAGSRELTKSFAADDRAAALATLQHFAGRQVADLSALLPDLSNPEQAAAQRSLSLLRLVDGRAEALQQAADCGASCPSPSAADSDRIGVLPGGSVPTTSLTPTPTLTASPGSGSSSPPLGTGGTQPLPSTGVSTGSDLGSTVGGVVGNLPLPSTSSVLPQPSASTSATLPLPTSTTSSGTTSVPLPSTSSLLPQPSTSSLLGDVTGTVGSVLPSASSTSTEPLPTVSSLPLPGLG